ncbi:MAG: TIGR03084 family metal-binding protein [Acidimicrobiales bacterium]
MSEWEQLRTDLVAEQAAVAALVSAPGTTDWDRPTPAAGWDVHDQIAHLAYFDAAAAQALDDEAAFLAAREALAHAATARDLDAATLARGEEPPRLLARWARARESLTASLARAAPGQRVPWYGPAMSAVSFARARLMETWAHGHDVGVALTRPLAPTDRLVHVARLGLATRAWSYHVRSETPPPGRVSLRLRAPSGATWTIGPEDADDWVEGPAEDLCLVVTQRRHVDDTALRAGELAHHWLVRAQAFAGGPTLPPAPGPSS